MTSRHGRLLFAAILSPWLAQSLPAAAEGVPQEGAALSLPSPSSASLQLARNIPDNSVADAERRRAEEGIKHNLLTTTAAWRGAGCDPQSPACVAAAEKLAREEAPALLAARRDISDQVRAIVFDRTMSAADIRSATAFLGTPAGRSFSRSLLLSTDFTKMPPDLLTLLSKVILNAGAATFSKGLTDRFYDATAALPRRTLPMAPPPPQPTPTAGATHD